MIFPKGYTNKDLINPHPGVNWKDWEKFVIRFIKDYGVGTILSWGYGKLQYRWWQKFGERISKSEFTEVQRVAQEILDGEKEMNFIGIYFFHTISVTRPDFDRQFKITGIALRLRNLMRDEDFTKTQT